MKQTVILTIILILSSCMYTGGYEIVSGKKAKEKITAKVSQYSRIGLATLFSSSTYSCPTDSSTNNVTNDTESNDTFKTANQATYPTSEKTTRIKGTISSDSDVDVFYMPVTTAGTLYMNTKSGYAACYVYQTTSNELTNDSSTSLYSTYDVSTGTVNQGGNVNDVTTSNYIFMKCEKGGTDYTYDIEFSLTQLVDSSSSANSNFSSSTSGSTMSDYATFTLAGQIFMYSKIEGSKKYTKSSLDACLNKLETVVPIASIVNINSLLSASLCGTTYIPFNEYFAAGLTCKLEEVSAIQIGDLGVP